MNLESLMNLGIIYPEGIFSEELKYGYKVIEYHQIPQLYILFDNRYFGKDTRLLPLLLILSMRIMTDDNDFINPFNVDKYRNLITSCNC